MKKYIAFFAAAVLALSFTACNQNRLDITQKGAVSTEEFYNGSDESCLQALSGVYSSVFHSSMKFMTKMVGMTELLSDDMYKSSSGYKWDEYHQLMLSAFDSTHGDLSDTYKTFFKCVSRCNEVIDNFKDSNSTFCQQAVAEARTIRSWAYIYVISMWGTPPKIDRVIGGDEMRQPNCPSDSLWNWTIKTLDEAINSGKLPSKADANDKSVVRVSNEFALALKGKAQVFAGDFEGAKTTLKKIIDSKKYELIPGDKLSELFFTSEGNHNSESMFEANMISNADNYKSAQVYDQWGAYMTPRVDRHKIVDGSYFSNFPTAWGYYNPTMKFIDAILANEGPNSNRFKAWFWSYERVQELGIKEFRAVRDADPKNKNKKILEKTTFEVPSVDVPSGCKEDYLCENCGFWTRKFHIKYDDIWNKDYGYDKVDRRLFRYAEVLLLYAEACACAKSGDDGSGLKALNDVAARAGAPQYTELTMKNVKQEKWFEMYGEYCRFIDIIRWGDGPTELANHWNEVPVFFGYKAGKSAKDLKDDYSNYKEVYELRQFDIKATRGVDHHFRVGKDEILPFPATEIANNPSLKQNPGWE